MKPVSQRRRPSRQLNLPLLDVPAGFLPDDKQGELVLALVELLVDAAQSPEGDEDEP